MILNPLQRLVPGIQNAVLLFFLALSLPKAGAAPTHELRQDHQIEAGHEKTTLPSGTKVEVITDSGQETLAKFTADNGSVRVIQLPSSLLQKIAVEAPAGPGSNSGASPEKKAPEPAPVPLPETAVSSSNDPHGSIAPTLVPGQSIVLSFPELGPSYQSDPARIQIRIPENYRTDQPVPLALYFGGGEGTESYDTLKGLVDTQAYVLVAFPYSKNSPIPRLAIKENKSTDLIRFQRPMLERVQKLIPNTDPKRRVAIGFSSGAHMMGIASCDGWKEFTDYFSAFVFDEGGSSENRDFRSLKRKDVMFVRGEKSPNHIYNLSMVKRFEDANVKAFIFEAPGEGHEMGTASRQAIREWIAKLAAK